MKNVWFDEFITEPYVEDDCCEPRTREEWEEYTYFTNLSKEELRNNE
jgi:hypothetical protein